MTVDEQLLDGLDDGQVAAVVAMLTDPRPVIPVVGPAGAGKTTRLAAAVTSWQRAGIGVFGVGPSATAARQLRDGAGTVADTLHKLVYEHSAKQTAGRRPTSVTPPVPHQLLQDSAERHLPGFRVSAPSARRARPPRSAS